MRISDDEVTKFLLNFINEGDFVIDVGCGNCSRLRKLKKVDDINAFGIDISLQKSMDSEINCLEMRAEDIDKLPEKFNLIFTVYSFHHFSEPERFLLGAKNMLMNGGRLIIIDWMFNAITDNPYEEYYKSYEIEKFLTDAGFKIENKIFRGDTQIFVAFNDS